MGRREVVWEGGVALAIVGALALVLSILWVVLCAGGFAGPCLGTPFQGRQGFLEFLGGLVLVAGLVLILVGKRPRAAPERPAPSG